MSRTDEDEEGGGRDSRTGRSIREMERHTGGIGGRCGSILQIMSGHEWNKQWMMGISSNCLRLVVIHVSDECEGDTAGVPRELRHYGWDSVIVKRRTDRAAFGTPDPAVGA